MTKFGNCKSELFSFIRIKKRIVGILFLFLTSTGIQAGEAYRWHLVPGKDAGICWNLNETKLPHYDNIEMAGLQVAAVVRYGVNENGSFYLNRGMVWPMLRTIPNNTHASLMRRFGEDVLSKILINGRTPEGEKVTDISINGTLTVNSTFSGGISLKRVLFPSTSLPVLCENYTLVNNNQRPVRIEVPASTSTVQTPAEEGVSGSYTLVLIQTGITKLLKPGESVDFSVTIGGYKPTEQPTKIDVKSELKHRNDFISEVSSNLILETPDSALNTLFRFSKIRASESIYKTHGGLMHGPGGESFYAAIWANDQAEYANPFFPYLGYDKGNESALVAFRHFARFMNKEYKPIPSSIIAEGDDIWHGAGDRGDGAMIAYGASRYALARGDMKIAAELWPLIEWCLEFCHRKLNADGVVGSDADELEGRFPAGKANLCTSSLYYDALISAGYLGKELGKADMQLRTYRQQANNLREAMNKYFPANVEGFETYRYYDGNTKLRSWICIPLTVGITERKEGTIAALLSPKLFTENGLLTESGDDTFWDRTTLYALRGILTVGETAKAMDFLKSFSRTRLLGERVPYVVEAWPEGGKRHLAAESALYCRIFTEGLFGIRPVGLKSFTVTPKFPKEWNEMSLKKVHGFQKVFDILVQREGNKIRLSVISNGRVVYNRLSGNGMTHVVKL